MTPDPAIQRIASKAKNAGVKLLASLSETDLAMFEQERGVELPADYRAYLLQIANGGAGPPEYGLGSLGSLPSDYRLPAPDLSKPFPFTRSWVWEDGETSPEGQQDDTHYGVLILGTDGCAQYWALVVNGPERGKIWMFTDVGIMPLVPGMTFSGWFEAWLDGKRDWWG
jgi:SMI1 / KNR4 family (SUKH-1)